MSAEKLEYYKFQSIINRLRLVVGLLRKEDSGFFYKFLIHIYLVFFIIPIFGSINFLFVNITNIIIATRALSLLLGFSTTMIKAISLIVNREGIDELHGTLDQYFNELLKTPEMSKHVLNKIAIFRRLPSFLTTFTVLLCGFVALGPILSIFSQVRHKVSPINYHLAYPGTYPWNIKQNMYVFSCHLIDEYLLTVSIAIITSTVDSLYTYYVYQMIGVLREITHRISTFDDSNSEFVVRECVNKYNILVNCIKKFEKIYGFILLWTMNVNAIVLCVLIYQLSHPKSVPFASLVYSGAHAALKLSQVFIFAWTGQLLTTESENLRDAIYASRWRGNQKLKSSIIIMLSQKPLYLSACNFLNVTIDMFVKVGNTTISYYLLLKTFEQS